MCVYDEHPLAGQDIKYRAHHCWSRYKTPFDEKNNQFITNYQCVSYLLKNTTIPSEYYLQYPVNTTYNRGQLSFGLSNPTIQQKKIVCDSILNKTFIP